MKKWKDKHIGFNVYLYLMLGIVLLLGCSFFVVAYEQEEYERALDEMSTSIRLAEELRQSSNDLTRLARTYISTGDILYKKQFNMVVDIRDGKQPRPENYSLAYWDFKAVKKNSQQDEYSERFGEAVPLLDLLRRAGVTNEEVLVLEKSKAYSDKLVSIEKSAMALIERNGVQNPEAKDRALFMVVDDEFLSLKAQVMRSVIDAETLITKRTRIAVEAAHQRLRIAIGSLFAFGGLLVVLMLKLRRQIKLILGCSIPELQNVISKIGAGDFFFPIEVPANAGDSVLGWVAQTQHKLAELNFLHFKFIVDSSDDAIISKSDKGVIASWNHGAEKIFGYTADEMIGRPMQTIIPEDRLHEEPEILARISRGEAVDHFETKRLHRNGNLIDVSVSVSPVYDVNGCVVGASKIARDITKAKAAEAEIHRLAFFDTLTGLANRRLLQDRIQQSIYLVSRGGNKSALLFLDMDNFKKLNDTKGHDAGDELLKEVAKRLLSCVRESDTVARFGGDEFVVLLNGKVDDSHIEESIEWVEIVLRKIVSALQQPYHVFDFVHSCTTSVGAVICHQGKCTTGDLLKAADAAMYEAKQMGKNCYKIADAAF